MDIQSIILSVDSDVHLWWVYVIIMVVMVLLSAFFSMSETAFSSANQAKLKVMIEDRKAGAKKALEMSEKFERTLTTLLVGNNIVNTALAVVGATFFALFINDGNAADAVATAVITIVLLIFGEIGPKTIAKTNPEKIACSVAIIIYILSIILFPIVIIFVGLQKLLTRNKDEADDALDEDELGAIIDEMEENGKIEDDEVNMIKNVFTLNDRTAEDIMIPRIKMEAINYNATLEEVKEFMLDNAYSRVPVFKTDKDHVVGILYERDFFPALVKNPKMSWKKLLRPVKFVSSAMKVDALFSELQASKTHIAIVSGEYGDVLGLVTMEDALEELVGEIYDEHDIPGDKDLVFTEEEDGSFIVDGEWFVEDLFEKLNIGNVPEDVPSKLASWMFAKCESLPEVGFEMQYLARYTMQNEETNEYDDFSKMITFRIHEVESRRIHLVKIIIKDATEEEIQAYEETIEE